MFVTVTPCLPLICSANSESRSARRATRTKSNPRSASFSARKSSQYPTRLPLRQPFSMLLVCSCFLDSNLTFVRYRCRASMISIRYKALGSDSVAKQAKRLPEEGSGAHGSGPTSATYPNKPDMGMAPPKKPSPVEHARLKCASMGRRLFPCLRRHSPSSAPFSAGRSRPQRPPDKQTQKRSLLLAHARVKARKPNLLGSSAPTRAQADGKSSVQVQVFASSGPLRDCPCRALFRTALHLLPLAGVGLGQGVSERSHSQTSEKRGIPMNTTQNRQRSHHQQHRHPSRNLQASDFPRSHPGQRTASH